MMQTPLVHYSFLRRVVLGLALAIYVALITLWAGKKSGAHANPVLTLAFFRLKKIGLADVVAYFIFQFAGAIMAIVILRSFFLKYFSDPAIDFGRAKPEAPHSILSGFVAEFLISFIFASVVLFGLSCKKIEKFLPAIVGLLIGLFIVFELPYSGMSMNPARSLSGAVAADNFTGLWIYFVAPIIGALLAAEIFFVVQKKQLYFTGDENSLINQQRFWGSMQIPDYPISPKTIAEKEQ